MAKQISKVNENQQTNIVGKILVLFQNLLKALGFQRIVSQSQISIPLWQQFSAFAFSLLLGLIIYQHVVVDNYNELRDAYRSANPIRTAIRPVVGPELNKIILKNNNHNNDYKNLKKVAALELFQDFGLLPSTAASDGEFKPADDDPSYALWQVLSGQIETTDSLNILYVAADKPSPATDMKQPKRYPDSLDLVVNIAAHFGNGSCGGDDNNSALKEVLMDILPLTLVNPPFFSEKSEMSTLSLLRPQNTLGGTFEAALYRYDEIAEGVGNNCAATFQNLLDKFDKSIKSLYYPGRFNNIPRLSSERIIDPLLSVFRAKPGDDYLVKNRQQIEFMRRFLITALDRFDNEPEVKRARKNLVMIVGGEQAALIILFVFALSRLCLRAGHLIFEFSVLFKLGQLQRTDSEKEYRKLVKTFSEKVEEIKHKGSCVVRAANVAIALAERDIKIFDAVKKSKKGVPSEATRMPLSSEFRQVIAGFESSTQSNRWVLHVIMVILPAIGFLGTVRGIMNALSEAPIIMAATTPNEQQVAIGIVAGTLALAFATTFFALLINIVLTVLSRFEARGESMFFSKLESDISPLVNPTLGLGPDDSDDSDNDVTGDNKSTKEQ